VLAKGFAGEDDTVKMQILNLAVKLFLSNPRQTSLLFKYVMDLCKYDCNYDIRDRARSCRSLFFKKKEEKGGALGGEDASSGDGVLMAGLLATPAAAEVKEVVKKSFGAPKPTPAVDLPWKGRSRYVLGSLSQVVDHNAAG
jgi:AP-3 complex subunit beta